MMSHCIAARNYDLFTAEWKISMLWLLFTPLGIDANEHSDVFV